MNLKIVISRISICLSISFCCIFSGCQKKIEVDSIAVSSTIKTDKPDLKVFIENSGSMDGYMCNGSQLKDALYDYVSDLNRSTDSTELYYINSAIIPYKSDLTSYIKDLTPSKFHQAGGNTSNTDLGSLIAKVLETVNDSTVSIFVSDCILDLPSKDAQKFLTHCEIRIKEEIINAQKRIPDLGVEILKLSSDFNGRYFYPNGKVETLNGVKRPYYIWILGDKNYLAKLNSDVPLSMLVKYNLGGVVSFSNQSSIPFEIKNKNLTGSIVTSTHGDYHITILADFRTTLQPDGVIQDKSNYMFNNSNLVIDGVYPISDKNSKFTHFLNFTIPNGTQIAQDCLIFNSPKLPSWISESNDETGDNIHNNLDKTTGIKYLIQGVADAYKNETVCTKMNFNVNRR